MNHARLRVIIRACAVCVTALVVGAVLAGCGGSSTPPAPPSTASLARTFIERGHALYTAIPNGTYAIRIGWHMDPARSTCTADESTGDATCDFYFIGHPKPPEGNPKAYVYNRWHVDWHCGSGWAHCHIADKQDTTA
jgi:hypothetical protein